MGRLEESKRAPRKPKKGATGVQLGEHVARAMILRGAAFVFAAKGARLASVEDILEGAGVSRRTFYRSFTSKEDVMVALYRFGTGRLIEACGQAIAEERDPIRQLERCIDAHIGNARDLGRLVFVLGGEAQRHESDLHAIRMEVHDKLASLFTGAASRHAGVSVDPLVARALILGLEGVTRLMLEEGDQGRNVSEESIARARRVAMRLMTATLDAKGGVATPLPTIDPPSVD